jgi:hypothetical protein
MYITNSIYDVVFIHNTKYRHIISVNKEDDYIRDLLNQERRTAQKKKDVKK